MIYVHLMGGLGNQLFQIYNLIAYCLRHKLPFKIPRIKRDMKSAEGADRPTYWDTFFKRLQPFLIDKVNVKIPAYEEKHFHYQPLHKVENTDFIFFGYFSSFRYFEDQFRQINKLISLKDLKKDCGENYSQYFANPCISLHFRHGDYKNIQDSHPILSNQYYINSLQNIIQKTNKKDWTCLYFCEEEDNAAINVKIRILKRRFKDLKFIKVDDSIKDWEQVLIMSLCSHNIIANSTFSWWGAHFNEHNDKIVCYPNVWFGPKLQNKSTKDLFPATWDKIKNN